MTSENPLFRRNRDFWGGLLPADVAEMMAARSARDGVDNQRDAASQRVRGGLVRSANALAANRGLRRFPPSDRLKELVSENLNKRFIRQVRRTEGGQINDPLGQEVLRVMNPDS